MPPVRGRSPRAIAGRRPLRGSPATRRRRGDRSGCSRKPASFRLRSRLLSMVRLLGGGAFGAGRGDRDERLELEETRFPDAADVHQLLDLLEAAILLPVLQD